MNEQVRETMKGLADQVQTEEEALSLFHVLSARFDWSGTVFTPEDVRNEVQTILDGQGDEHEYLDAYAQALESEVLGSYEYRKLGDGMSERGNETLSDAVVFSPLFREGEGITFCVVLGVDDERAIRTEAVEVGPFDSSQRAHEAGLAGVSKVAEAQEDNPMAEFLVSDEKLIAAEVKGFSLVVVRDGETLAEYPAMLEEGVR